jgi:hypothetical protein
MNPQLEIHQHEIWGMLQNVIVSEALTLEASNYEFLSDHNSEAMSKTLLIAKQNSRDAHKALEDLRQFIASEFSFKDSFSNPLVFQRGLTSARFHRRIGGLSLHRVGHMREGIGTLARASRVQFVCNAKDLTCHEVS